MDNRKIVGLMACDPRGVIGKKGALPWSYPEELEHFRKITFGQIMVMGHKTFESVPLATLKDRFNIVFSRHPQKVPELYDNIIFVSSLSDFLALGNMPADKEMFMIGGAEIAKLFLTAGLLSEFLLTKIQDVYEGDAIFPLILLQDWSCELIRKEKNFTIYKYMH